MQTDSTASDTEGPAGAELEVLPSSVAVLEANEMGALTVQCLLYESGEPVAEPDACAGGLPTATVLVPLTWQGRGPAHFTDCI